jgi:hypothetical protein
MSKKPLFIGPFSSVALAIPAESSEAKSISDLERLTALKARYRAKGPPHAVTNNPAASQRSGAGSPPRGLAALDQFERTTTKNPSAVAGRGGLYFTED